MMSNGGGGVEEVYTICHTPYTIHHTPYTIHHTPYTIRHTPYCTLCTIQEWSDAGSDCGSGWDSDTTNEGVWCMVYGVWCMVCGVWGIVYDQFV